jgi:hypothetical protein
MSNFFAIDWMKSDKADFRLLFGIYSGYQLVRLKILHVISTKWKFQ